MLKKLARDIMIPLDKYPHIPHWYTLRQALEEMEKVQLVVGERKSLPRVVLVFSEFYQLLGIARRRDILRGLDPEYLAGILLAEQGGQVDQKLVDGIRKNAERPISDVMYPVKVWVDFDDHIVKIIDKIVEHDLTLIPVLREGEVVGVVRTVDVCEEIKDLLRG